MYYNIDERWNNCKWNKSITEDQILYASIYKYPEAGGHTSNSVTRAKPWVQTKPNIIKKKSVSRIGKSVATESRLAIA